MGSQCYEILKEPAITQRFIGWKEDWEKEKHKDSGAVARTMFENKYKDTTFYLPDTNETYHVDDEGIQFLRGCSGWLIIYENSDKPGVEEKSLTPFLAFHLIWDTPQAVGVKVEQPQPGSKEEEIYGHDTN